MQVCVVTYLRESNSRNETGVLITTDDGTTTIVTRDGEMLEMVWHYWPQHWAGAILVPEDSTFARARDNEEIEG